MLQIYSGMIPYTNVIEPKYIIHTNILVVAADTILALLLMYNSYYSEEDKRHTINLLYL